VRRPDVVPRTATPIKKDSEVVLRPARPFEEDSGVVLRAVTAPIWMSSVVLLGVAPCRPLPGVALRGVAPRKRSPPVVLSEVAPCKQSPPVVLSEVAPCKQSWTWPTVREFIDADLMRALRGDSLAATERFPSRMLINFDPFLDSQDPCPRYDVAVVHRVGGVYKVTVRPVCADPRWQTQRPVVDVMLEDGHWKITNVTYDHNGTKDLRSLLCEWAKADLKPERRPTKC
jgi:hypothetical protein